MQRILYVEDDPDIRIIGLMALEEVGGFTVTACSSGREALDRAAGAEADVILLDVMMPDMDGYATLRALRALPETASTPVIFMTAKVQAAEIARHELQGAVGVIAKPFDPLELPQQIRRLCGG
ncbi:MAG TPA: response regulator [Ramlibacter sp.]|uniref:response regulator n=1 Tax=Ramlibacter sp. TaxID=1917967 RepID=UPI002CEB09BE|nr:response regulator [Ramlibacter sp.]HVZ42957.1 response regulator [Ramlibacter sp.]